MKKIIALLTVIALVATCFAGCKKTDTTSSDVNSSVGEVSSEINSNESDKESSNTDSTNSDEKKNGSSNNDVNKKPSSNSLDNKTPSSNSSTNNINPSQNTTVNYDVVDYTISYHADSHSTFLTNFNTEYWKMPYAKEDDGSMVRDGYVLLGYSFDADGKGELIRPGYKYVLPSKNSNQNLYCVWAKETNPSFFRTTQKSSSEVYITAYTGSDSLVYIPRKIGGNTVTGIASGAFANNKTITEVHITSSVLVVENQAFASCSNLKAVTLYDNLKTISDASFAGSPVKTVRMCAGKTPRYINNHETYGKKYERLTKTHGQKRIIVLAGSSALYGIDSDYMQSLFRDNYTVINFGTNASMNVIFYLDAILPHLTKNDIVVYAPEQYGPYAYHSNGNPELTNVNFKGISTCYNLFENVDVSTYTNVFNSIGQYCTESARMPQLSWENYSTKIDEFGDIALTKGMNSSNFRYGANGYFKFDNSVIPAEYIPNLNRIINKVKNTGAKILFSYPPHNKNNILNYSLNENSYNNYNNWISNTVQCQLISDIRNYIYNGEYFWDTDYHLNTVGRKLHTKQLAQDIINAGIGVK